MTGPAVRETVMLAGRAERLGIRHARAETSRERTAHIAQLTLDGLRPQPR